MTLQIVGDVTIETEVETVRIIEELVQFLSDASRIVAYAHRALHLFRSQIGSLLCRGFNGAASALNSAPCLVHALEKFDAL